VATSTHPVVVEVKLSVDSGYLALWIFSMVASFGLGSAFGFFVLKNKLESKMVGVFDFEEDSGDLEESLQEELDELEGDLD